MNEYTFFKMPIMNALYLGMATDIMAPLLLLPDVDVIYVMNTLDKAFGCTWEEHKLRICTVLEQGSDKNIKTSYTNYPPKSQNPIKDVHTLLGPSTLVSNIDNYKTNIEAKWVLEFIYNGKSRKLIYYYDFNFVYHVWPEEIRNIHHILWNGTYTWDMLITDYDYDDDYCPSIKTFMMERMAYDAYLYALSFNHTWFPEHIWIYDGHERDGHSVAKLKLDFTDPNWWKENSN